MAALLERATLLATLREALAASAGAGRLVLVAGEAGIGRSSLVRELAERHADGARVAMGACDPLLTPRALGPVHDLARELGAGSPRCSARRGHARRCSPRCWTS